MDKGTDKQVREFLAEVELKYSNLTGAYLFGSYARGTQRKDSDIDIALIFDAINDERKFELQIQLMFLASQYDSRIEPHPVSKGEFDSYNPFIAEIKRGGIDLLTKMQHSK